MHLQFSLRSEAEKDFYRHVRLDLPFTWEQKEEVILLALDQISRILQMDYNTSSTQQNSVIKYSQIPEE